MYALSLNCDPAKYKYEDVRYLLKLLRENENNDDKTIKNHKH